MRKKPNLFTEIGFDKDNNKYLFGISSETEHEDGTETRKSGFIKINKIYGIYIRLWILKTVILIGIPAGFVIQKKKRNNFKLVLGVSGLKSTK